MSKPNIPLNIVNSASSAINANDVGYDLILLIGQSNMAGRGTALDSRFDILDPRIFTYGNPVQTGDVYNSVISQAVEPLLQRDGATAIGPGIPFARWYTTISPANRRILLVPCAQGGSPLVPTNQVSWNSTVTGTNSLYQSALTTVQAALTQAGANSRITAALWLQGETDGDSSATGSTYQAALDALIAKLRSDLSLPNLPFVVGQMVPDYLSSGTRAAINAVHIDTPRRLIATAFGYGPSGSAYNNGDGNHYNALGQRGPVVKPQLSVGQSMFLAYQRSLVNVMGTAAVVPTAPTVIQTSGSAVAVSWAQVLGRVTDYNVRYSTNSGSTWSSLTRSQSIDVTAAITGISVGANLQVQVASVNEQGASAWSASGTLNLVTIPGQVTGLTLGATSGTSQALSWTAVSTANSYTAEKSTDGGTTWTSAGSFTATAGTVTGLSPSTTYQFRVSAVNVAGTGTPSSTVSATTASAVGPISVVGVAAYRAYGLRRVRDAYSGSAIQVRRSSDSSTQNIGFDGSGNLDTTALLAFVGSGSGYVQTWYDQSGNGYNVSNTTASQQPQIVNAGSLLTTPNGKPKLTFASASSQTLFDATNLSVSNSLYSQGALTACMVLNIASPAALTVVAGDSYSTSSPTPRYWMPYGNASTTYAYVTARNDASTVLYNQASTAAPLFNGTLNQYSGLDTGTQTAQYVNGATAAALANYTTARTGTLTPNRFSISGIFQGSTTPAYLVNGDITEVIIFGSALSTANRQTVEANQKNYFATP